LRDGLEGARCAVVDLSAQEVQVEAAANGTECDSLVAQEPFLTMSLRKVLGTCSWREVPSRGGRTIASVDPMRGRRTICTVASLLVERELPVHVPIDCVAAVSGVERLCIVCSQTEIVDIFRKPVDVVMLFRDVSLAQ
jgi:hypothetical protein